jgi:cysteine synthase
MSRSDRTLPSILDAVGDTPLVELSRFTAGLQGRLLAKLEYLNPGLSKKDRIGLQMIEEAEASGQLKPGQPIVAGSKAIPLSRSCREAIPWRGPG